MNWRGDIPEDGRAGGSRSQLLLAGLRAEQTQSLGAFSPAAPEAQFWATLKLLETQLSANYHLLMHKIFPFYLLID